MKKLTTIKEFENNNSELVLSSANSAIVLGGIAQSTGDWCQTLDDTCVNNRSDIHHAVSHDGVTTYDKTTWND